MHSWKTTQNSTVRVHAQSCNQKPPNYKCISTLGKWNQWSQVYCKVKRLLLGNLKGNHLWFIGVQIVAQSNAPYWHVPPYHLQLFDWTAVIFCFSFLLTHHLNLNLNVNEKEREKEKEKRERLLPSKFSSHTHTHTHTWPLKSLIFSTHWMKWTTWSLTKITCQWCWTVIAYKYKVCLWSAGTDERGRKKNLLHPYIDTKIAVDAVKVGKGKINDTVS